MMSEDRIQETNITSILSNNFLDYSMSVIVSRAIPDVRDGLKPVHRRILYAMHDLGIYYDKSYKKSARIVGDVIGKYHPHGDSAVYDTMVRMAQSWKMRQPMVDGHGNFGSIDGDSPAAMRYTESRMAKIAHEILRDIKDEKGRLTGVVDFVENFDGEEQEPSVLPSRIPNLLVNGTDGIAVGMATSIPPHNLKEVIEAVIATMENEDITVEELMEYVKGPDMPTGATILGTEGIKRAYSEGKGSFIVRGVTEQEYINGNDAIVIKQIPYNVNKEKFIKSIKQIQLDYDEYYRELKKKKAKKLTAKGLDFIARDGLRDETEGEDPTNVRVVIELKTGVNPDLVLNYLYKHTQLQTSFSIINLALVPKKYGDNQMRMEPKVLTLKQMIEEYIKHQQEVTERKLQYELSQKEKEMHVLDAVIRALGKLDETVELIRKSKSREDAIEGLESLLSLDKKQAVHILGLRLQRLASFEQEEQYQAHEQLEVEIKEIRELLASVDKMNEIIKGDLKEMIEQYGSERRTKIGAAVGEINAEDLIDHEDVVITMTHNGFIKRIPENKYRTQRKAGRGVTGMSTFEDDFVSHVQVADNHDTLMCITNKGSIYRMKAYQVPVTNTRSKGVSIRTIFDMESEEYIQAILSISEFSKDQFLVFGTKYGLVKRTRLSEYARSTRNGIRAITLNKSDEVVNVSLTSGENRVTLITHKGISITFEEDDVRVVSRAGKGVKGIDLTKDDFVVSASIHQGMSNLFIATNKGIGKRTPLAKFRVQNRGGKGVRAITADKTNGYVVGSLVVEEDEQIILLTKNGSIMKLDAKDISSFSRTAKGSRVINLKEDDELQAFDRNKVEEDEGDFSDESEVIED